MIRYPRTAGPLFGPNAPYADESIETGVNMTKTAINADGQMVVAGLSLGSITADAVQRSLDADPNRPPSDRVTFIVSGDPSRITPLSTGIG
ncbi:MAG TPA: PE-PPE domain-containing protein, partial [Mycobacterium sp.]